MPARILIIDDDEAVLKTVARYLASEEYEVLCVSHPGQLVDALKEGPFTHAVVDVNLSDGIDGICVAKDLQHLRPGIRVVLMSGNPVEGNRVAAAGLGPLLAKPFSREELLGRMGESGS